jgi:hypothetical protein
MVHSACLVTPGSENRAHDHEGTPGNLGAPDSSTKTTGRGASGTANSRMIRLPVRLGPSGNERQTLRGIAKRRKAKRGETTVSESQRPIVAVKQGNGASRTLGIEGAPSYGHAVGNTTRTQSLNRVSPNTA